MHRTSELSNTMIDGLVTLFKVVVVITCILNFAIGRYMEGIGYIIAVALFYRSMQKESFDLFKYFAVFLFIVAMAQTIRLITLPFSIPDILVGFVMGVIIFWILKFITMFLIKIIEGTDRAVRKLL